MFPVRLQLQKGLDAATALKSIKEQLRKIPDRGLSYGLLRYLGDDRAERKALEMAQRPQVLFNYLGQFDQIVSNSEDFFVLPTSRQAPGITQERGALTNSKSFASIRNGKLEAKWIWDTEQLVPRDDRAIGSRLC